MSSGMQQNSQKMEGPSGSSTLILSRGGRLVNQEQIRLAREIHRTIAESSQRKPTLLARLLGRG